MRTFGQDGTHKFYFATFSSDGQLILTASSNQKAQIWDLKGRKLLTLKDHVSPFTHASFSPDGNRVTSCCGGSTSLWDLSLENIVSKLRERGCCSRCSVM